MQWTLRPWETGNKIFRRLEGKGERTQSLTGERSRLIPPLPQMNTSRVMQSQAQWCGALGSEEAAECKSATDL